MVDPVAATAAAAAAVPGVVALGRPLALRVAGVVAHEAGAAHQQVEQEAEHLHGDGDQEEDERVAPLVLDEQLGEDPGQRDDHPRRAWTARGGGRGSEGSASDRKGEEVREVALLLTLSGHHPLRVSLGQHPHVAVEAGLLHWRGGGGWGRGVINAGK